MIEYIFKERFNVIDADRCCLKLITHLVNDKVKALILNIFTVNHGRKVRISLPLHSFYYIAQVITVHQYYIFMGKRVRNVLIDSPRLARTR